MTNVNIIDNFDKLPNTTLSENFNMIVQNGHVVESELLEYSAKQYIKMSSKKVYFYAHDFFFKGTMHVDKIISNDLPVCSNNENDGIDKEYLLNYASYRWTENSNENGINSAVWNTGEAYGGITTTMFNGVVHPWIPWSGLINVQFTFKIWIEDISPSLPSSTLAIDQITNMCSVSSTVNTIATFNLERGACGCYTYHITPTISGDNVILRLREQSGLYSNRWCVSYLTYFKT
jgi:hypothetical protein